MGGKMAMLTTGDANSLVIENPCPQAGGDSATVACFYFDFAAGKKQSPVIMLGSLLKQLVFGLEDPGGGSERVNYKNQENAIGGQGRQIPPTPIMLGNTCSKKRVFICTDSPGKCAAEHWGELLDSVNDMLQQSPGTRIFVTGRPRVYRESKRRLAGFRLRR